jgi:hypothetical protein
MVPYIFCQIDREKRKNMLKDIGEGIRPWATVLSELHHGHERITDDEKLLGDDEDVVMKRLQLSSKYIMDSFGPVLAGNKHFVKKAIECCATAIMYANEELRNDPELAEQACWKDIKIFTCLGNHLKKDKEFIKKLGSWNNGSHVLELWPCIKKDFSQDRPFVIELLEINGLLLGLLDASWKEDKEICDIAIKSHQNARKYATYYEKQLNELSLF